MNSRIWISPPDMTGEELKYIQNSLSENWVSSVGPHIDEFEGVLQGYLGNKTEVVALNSGTSAIHLALIQLGVKQGDEVICQSFTFSASANPILYLGAIPIFVDSEKDTWNICPQLLEEAIKDRISKGKKPKAILAVHLYGMPYKIDEVHYVAKKYDIPIIEDAAEALGSEYKGRKCGTFGDIGILSFNGNKIITTSAGGALICNSKEIKNKIIHLATQAKDDAPHYQHSKVGYNYRISNVLSGIGLAQMKVIGKRVASRRKNYNFYFSNLDKLPTISFLEEFEGSFANRWMTCILTESYDFRENLRLTLENNNIESKPLWKPLHEQPIFSEFPSYLSGVSSSLFKRGLCLPSGSTLSIKELETILLTINKIVNI